MNLPQLGVGVDVIVLTPEDIEAQRTSVGSIVGPALEEGRVAKLLHLVAAMGLDPPPAV
jgi:hypothetical protein